MLENIDALLQHYKDSAQMHTDQDSLFGGGDVDHEELTLPSAEPIDVSQKLEWEKELLGVYVSGHPLDQFKDELAKRTSIREINQAIIDEDNRLIEKTRDMGYRK